MSTPPNNQLSESDCWQMLDNFVSQKGNLGTQLLASLSQYIKFCNYKMQPLSPEDQQEVSQEIIDQLRKQKVARPY